MPAISPRPRRLFLGIDPGTHAAGWGLIEAHGPALRLVDCGVFKDGSRRPMGERLRKIFAAYEALLAAHRPEAAAVEATFAGVNPRSAIAMGEGRGVALLALARARIPVKEISPAEIKKAVTGNGGASKELVARMVCARLGLRETPRPADVTDALAAAIALTHRIR